MPGPVNERPVSRIVMPLRSVTLKRTEVAPASTIPCASPPGGGNAIPTSSPIHRTRNSPSVRSAMTAHAGGIASEPPHDHPPTIARIAWRDSPAARTAMSPAAPICRHPNDSLPTPPASDATPYPTRSASEAATSDTYATWFDSASGRYPAADSHASARPATAVSVARSARPRTSPDARLSANTAAIGRNQAIRTRARARPEAEAADAVDVEGADAGAQGGGVGGGEGGQERQDEQRADDDAAGREPDAAQAGRRRQDPDRDQDEERRRDPRKEGDADGERHPEADDEPAALCGRLRVERGLEPVREGRQRGERHEDVDPPVGEGPHHDPRQGVAGRRHRGGQAVTRLARQRPVHGDAGHDRQTTQDHLLGELGAAEQQRAEPAQRGKSGAARAGTPEPGRAEPRHELAEQRRRAGRERGDDGAPNRAGAEHVAERDAAHGDREDRRDGGRVGASQRHGLPAQLGARHVALVVVVDPSLFGEDLAGRLEPLRQPERRGLHEAADRPVLHPPDGLRADAAPDRARKVRDVPPPRGEQVPRIVEAPRERQPEEAREAEQRVQRQQREEREQSVVLQHGRERRALAVVPPRPRGRVVGTLAARGSRHVAGASERRHQHPEPGEPRAPAVVEVLVVGGESLVGHAGPLQALARDEHRARGHVHDLEDAIELALVDLAVLQGRVRMPEAVGGTADLAQEPGLVPVNDLGADDADVLEALDADRRLDEPRDAVGVHRGVVVGDEEVVGGGGGRHRREGRLHGAGDTQVLIEGEDTARSERGLEELVRLVGGGVVDGQDTQSWIGLRGERVQALADPARGVVRHEHGEHRRRAESGVGRVGLSHEGCTGHPRGAETSTHLLKNDGRGA